jgi:hypothetical protein
VLCAAGVEVGFRRSITFNAHIIETGTDSYRLRTSKTRTCRSPDNAATVERVLPGHGPWLFIDHDLVTGACEGLVDRRIPVGFVSLHGVDVVGDEGLDAVAETAGSLDQGHPGPDPACGRSVPVVVYGDVVHLGPPMGALQGA